MDLGTRLPHHLIILYGIATCSVLVSSTSSSSSPAATCAVALKPATPMPPRRNHHVFLALPTYLDFTHYRNAFKVVRHFLGQACYKSMLSDELRKRYGQESLPVQVDVIDFTLEQLNTVMSTVARRAKGNGLEPAEAWDQLRREAWPPVPSLPRCSSMNPASRPIESNSFPLPNSDGHSPLYTQDLDYHWAPAAAPHHSVSPSPLSSPFPEALHYDFSSHSFPLSPTEILFTSESSGGSSSHLPCPTTFHQLVVPPNTSNPIPEHHHDLHNPQSPSPSFNYGSDHSHYPIDDTCYTERKEVSLYSPAESRAAKRPRPCSPLPRPQPPPSTIYVPYSRYIPTLAKGHHEVFTAETNVYFSSENHILANFYSDPRAIYRTNRDDLDRCLRHIGQRTSTKPVLQCGTLGIVTSGRPVDVERAMDAVRYLMENVLPTLQDSESNPMLIVFVEQYICSREPYFSKFANLSFRDQEVSNQKTVFPVVPVPYEPEELPFNAEECSRQSLSIPEWRFPSSQTLKGFTAQRSFLELRLPSSRLQDPTMQDITDLTRMTAMGQYSTEDLRRAAVFSEKLEKKLPAQMVHKMTWESRYVSIPSARLSSRESDEDWTSFGATTDTNTTSQCSFSSSTTQLNSRGLESH